jgi:Family of unknown function (DUF5895)
MSTKKRSKTIQPNAMNPFEPIEEQIPDDYAAQMAESDYESVYEQNAIEAQHSILALPSEPVHDPYMDDAYSDADASYPRIQILRGEGNQKPCWFIPQDQLDLAGWLDPEPKLDTYHFASGQSEEGLIIYQPRLLVAAKSTLLAFDRSASADAQKMVLSGDYNQIPAEEKDNYGMVQFFRLYLLDDQNCPLAEMPFEYRAKGATRATFVKQWEQNCDEITRHHCKSVGKPFAKRNAVYRSLCVFIPQLIKEKVETTKANVMAAKVTGHVRPTAHNWVTYFLGRNENADWYTGVMDAGRPLISGVRTDQVAELPESKNLLMLPG